MANNIIVDYKKRLDIRLSKNVTAKSLLCVSTWAAIGSKVNNLGRVSLSNKTPIILIPTPPINVNRELTYLKINNYDSVSATVVINIDDIDKNNDSYNLLTVLLSPNDTLFFNSKDGFYILNYLGNLKPVQNTVDASTLASSVSGVSAADFNSHTGDTNPHGTTLIQLSGVSTTTFNTYTGTTNPIYSLTGHTHDITSLSGVSITDFNSHTGSTNPHGTTLTQLSGVSTTNFNLHTGATNPHGTTLIQLSGVSTTTFNTYTGTTNVPSYGSLYEDTPTGTTISVSNAGTTGWVTAVSNTHELTVFTNHVTADRITILSGGNGTYQINVIVNATYSNNSPTYSMGVYKNNSLIIQAQSFVSASNTTDRYNLTTNTIISGVTADDFFDVRFSSNNATPRNIIVRHITFNMNRIN